MAIYPTVTSVMMPEAAYVTPEEFDALVDNAANRERHLELLDGRVFEKVVSQPWSSEVSVNLSVFLKAHIRGKKLGRITGSDGGYQVGSHRFMPDCAFLRAEHAHLPVVKSYRAIAPDLAVEVLSPTDKAQAVLRKILAYRQAGVLLWVLDAKASTIIIYDGMNTEVVLGVGDTLTGGRVLPDFRVPVADIFEDEMA